MRPIYIWAESYGLNLISHQGFMLSSKYKVNVINWGTDRIKSNTKPWCHLEIIQNSMFADHFYGDNIFDIVAAVGQNGSGKTTLAHMLMDYSLDSLFIKKQLSNEPTGHFFIIYEQDVNTGKLSAPELCIITEGVDVTVSGTYAGCSLIPAAQLSHSDFTHTTVYISNVFNPAELRDDFTRGDITKGSTKIQQIYTPSVIMKRYQQEYKKAYHLMYDSSYNAVLYQLANLQSQDPLALYSGYQSASFINCYFHAPDSVKDALPVFERISIYFKPFAAEINLSKQEQETLNAKLNSMNPDLRPEEFLYLSQMWVYNPLKNRAADTEPGWTQHVLACCLSEVFLLFLTSGYDKERQIIQQWATQNSNPVNMNLWDSLKASIADKESPNASSGSAYCARIFNKYYQEAKAIIKLEQNFEEGTYYIEDIEQFLQFYEQSFMSFSIWTKYLTLELRPSSSGEMALVNIFSYMYRAFMKLNKHSNSNVLVIVDEIDAYLHPRWQQKILKWITDWCQEDQLFRDYGIQFFLTSHSPIFLSDIPSDRVLKLWRRSNNNAVTLKKATETFGADIYTLFYDSFFMEEGSIGNFSKAKINGLIQWLNRQNPDLSETQAMYLLNSIGDKSAKRQLIQMYRKKMGENNISSWLAQLSEEEQQFAWEYLEQMRNEYDKN